MMNVRLSEHDLELLKRAIMAYSASVSLQKTNPPHREVLNRELTMLYDYLNSLGL